MDVKLIKNGPEAEYVLVGKLDTQTSPEVEKIFNETSEGFDKIILNFEGVQYVSSAGLRVLRRLQVNMNKKGGDMCIKNAGKFVVELFEMTGFSSFLKLI